MIVLPILKPANSFVPCLNTLSKIYIPIAYRIPSVTSFSRMRIYVVIYAVASCMESVLNVA